MMRRIFSSILRSSILRAKARSPRARAPLITPRPT
ncbi:MAG: hypothetical protein EOP11_03005 [Proteobacteria bacterium]|nr:MAG: hypothetical protein EOP11_03005 [Pseudomonadota bacterium]